MNTQYSVFSLLLYLPVFVAAPLFGLLPLVTGPILVFFLSLIATVGIIRKKDSSPQIHSLFIFLLVGYLLAVSWQSDSYVFERSLALAGAILYGYVLLDACNEKTLLKFILISGSLFLSILFLATSFIEGLHPIYIALANTNALALQLAMIIPLTIKGSKLHITQDPNPLPFFILILATQLAALIFTKAQAMSAVLILSFILGANITSKKKWPLAILFAASVVFYKFFSDPIAIQDRWQWWRAALSIFKDYPLLGSIQEGGFLRLYPFYKGSMSASQSTTLAHNLYLEWLSDFGLVGSGLLLAMIYALRKKFTFSSWALKSSLFVFLFSGFFDSSHFFLPNMLTFLGICALAYRGEAPLTSQGTDTDFSQKSVSVPNRRHLSLILSLVFLLTISTQSLRLSVSRAYLFLAEFQLSRETLLPQEVNQIHQRLLKSLHWDKKNPYTWVDLMKVELLYHNFKDALEAVEQAARLDPHNKIYLRNIEIIKQRLP